MVSSLFAQVIAQFPKEGSNSWYRGSFEGWSPSSEGKGSSPAKESDLTTTKRSNQKRRMKVRYIDFGDFDYVDVSRVIRGNLFYDNMISIISMVTIVDASV